MSGLWLRVGVAAACLGVALAAWQLGGSAAPEVAAPGVVAPAPREPATRAKGAKTGADDADDAEDPDLPGKWRKLRQAGREDLTPEQLAEMERLEAIGYADGTVAVAADKVITVHDPKRAWHGLNLYNSGHASAAFIAEMDGTIRHTWSAKWAEVFPKSKLPVGAPGTNHWRRAKLLPDGGLLVIWEGRAMARLGRDSAVAWVESNNAHHDLALLTPNTFAVLTREAAVLPAFVPDKPVLQDFVEVRDLSGALVSRQSLLEALIQSPFASVLDGRERSGDLFHTNSIELLDGRAAKQNPAFTAGRWLVSMRNLDAVGVVDPKTNTFVWLKQGPFKKQHDANLVDGGLALFDNNGSAKFSRAYIFDVKTFEPIWTWEGRPDRPFKSGTLGTVQQLPNKNMLLTESDGGRAIEVTPAGDVVWEMYNPNRAGEHGELIAALFEVVRLAPADVPWLNR